MSTQQYSVTQHPISTLLTWIKSDEIAIPEIQRPFVWNTSQVRNLLDSLMNGYPVGYLIAWRNPTVRSKDGSLSAGKRILIDGQQRVTALMAALLGQEVVTKDYSRTRIRIAFHPQERRFEVFNPAIEKDVTWIPDIAAIFDPNVSLFDMVNAYCARNPGTAHNDIFRALESVSRITNNQIGLIELDANLDIETVTEIFIRVNSAGVTLGQADFAMSKIASNDTYDGSALRKAIDYFCHTAVQPDFHATIEKHDPGFAATDYYRNMAWLRRENDDLYDPTYADMLRVAFTSEFRRGKLADLVALLSGRNFETRQNEEAIVENTFTRLRSGVIRFMNETHFKRFVMIIRSAGFVDASMISSQNALNVAYIIYLTLRDRNVPDALIERHVRRWFVMSILTGRYSGSPETTIDQDVRQIDSRGIEDYAQPVIEGQLSDAYWHTTLPQELDTSVASSPYFRIFQAAQVKLNDLGFLSRDITAHDLITVKSDVHHVFPREYLKRHGMQRGQYNQIANYVIAQSEINIAIGSKEPRVYFGQLLDQCQGGPQRYGNITDLGLLRDNLRMHCIPDGVEHMQVADYPVFLAERRRLMALKLKRYFERL